MMKKNEKHRPLPSLVAFPTTKQAAVVSDPNGHADQEHNLYVLTVRQPWFQIAPNICRIFEQLRLRAAQPFVIESLDISHTLCTKGKQS